VYSKRSAGSRTQYNLRLAYAITTPKVQGETLESGVICFSKPKKVLVKPLFKFHDSNSNFTIPVQLVYTMILKKLFNIFELIFLN